MRPESDFGLSKLAINRENDNDATICQHDVIVNFFLMLLCFSCQVLLLVQVSRRYHLWFWSYKNLLLLGIDQKSGNRKYPRLSFAQYLIFGDWGRVRDTKFNTNV